MFLLGDAFIPSFVVVFIDLNDQPTGIDTQNHAYVAFEVLPTRYNSDLTIGSYNVVLLATHPDYFRDRSIFRYMKSLLRWPSVQPTAVRWGDSP